VHPEDSARTIRIDALGPADSPRLDGIDPAHVHRLSEIVATLPPILVNRATMRVIDGMHRVGAAALNGLEVIEAQFFDGADEEAFLRAVAANTEHGLPLSTADRKAAAKRILASHPSLSDRAVAKVAGLDAKTVAALRQGSTEDSPRLNTRLGSDGKVHPLDRTAERILASELIADRPDLPLRAVAKAAGISVGTAHDVRQRLLRGEQPVPPRPAARAATVRRVVAEVSPSPLAAVPADPEQPGPSPAPVRRAEQSAPGRRGALETLRRLAGDPSLRHTESGREFLRWLHLQTVVDDGWRQRMDAIPPHCVDSVADLAQQCADSWQKFSRELARRKFADRARAASAQARN
jgi:ParB-like chromosome segregation protein Spo0J